MNEKIEPVAAQEAVAYWRVTFRMYLDDPEHCVLFVGGQEKPSLDTLGVTPRPLELVSVEPRFVKQHRWDQYGERCLDCGDKDWMNDPVCRQRLADPSIEATPSIAVNPSTEVTAKSEAAPVAAAPDEMSPEFTDTARAAIAWVLWHHQGGSSPIGQPLRFALGMGDHDPLPDWRIAEAKRYAELAGATTADFHKGRASTPAAPGIDPHAPCTESVYALARKLLWIAYVWNDHNFDHPYKIARKLAAEFGIESFDQANAWLDEQSKLIDANPKGGSPVVTDVMVTAALRVQYARAGSVWTGTEVNPDFVDMRHILTAAMQATSAEVGS